MALHSGVMERLVSERKLMSAIINQIDEKAISDRNVYNKWTVKDILAHLAAWEAEVVRGLVQLRRGGRPKYWDATKAEYELLNKKWYEENKSRPLDRVLADFKGCRQQIIAQLGRFDVPALSRENEYTELQFPTVLEAMEVLVLDHEAEHRHDIGVWVRDKI